MPHSVGVLLAATAQPNTAWTLAPGVILAVLVGLYLYVVRWRRTRREGRERGHRPGTGRLLLWLGGLVIVLVALVSPIDAMADDLLVMHMVQHVLLLDVVPVLLILGLTRVLLRPATKRLQALEQRAGFLGHPATAAVLYVAVMWLWHVPVLYDAAADHEAVHLLEHVCFAFAGGLYWWHLLSPIPSRYRLRGLGPIVYMVGSKLGVGLLGVGLSFAPGAFYSHYEHGPRFWGLSAHDDQSLAGLVMATEQSIVMGIVLAWLFARMLGESDREDERAERYDLAEA